MANRTFLIGHFDVEGFGPDSVETPVTGKGPKAEYQDLWAKIKSRHPTVDPNKIKKMTSHVETRDTNDPGFIEVMPGTTLQGLFSGGAGTETTRKIGGVSYQSKLCDIVLKFSRARSACTIFLREYTGTNTPFGDQIPATRSVDDLPEIVKGVLGKEAKDIKLRIRKRIIGDSGTSVKLEQLSLPLPLK